MTQLGRGFLVGVVLTLSPGFAAGQANESVTYTRDVAPILQEKCETCHREGSIGPMPLRTYEEVRPWATLIKEKVVDFVMPPGPVDRTIGIQEFKNNRSLSDEQIRIIADWVDTGAALGDVADLPAPLGVAGMVERLALRGGARPTPGCGRVFPRLHGSGQQRGRLALAGVPG